MPAQIEAKTNKLVLATILSLWFLLFSPSSVFATAGINRQINFQGKLVSGDGTNVADGSYNMEFKIYQDGDGVPGGGDETLKWTETRTGGDKVTVTDGIFRVSLGSVTAFGSNIDFNQDTLWLSINIGGTGTPSWDGEMNPMVRFASVPYALNAEKVAGLTVTNTTGTLTIPDGKTIQFAEAFTTSGAFPLTLTTTASTDVILPTTGTLATLAGSEELTNKTIGSTGLVFSGASTDIDAAADEGLTIQGRAVSTFQTTAGNIVFQPAGTGTIATVQIGAGGAGSTTPDFLGLDVKSDTGDPAGGFEGAMYYNTADNKFRCYQASTWTDCIGAGGSTTLQQAYDAGSAGDQIVTLDAAQDSIIVRNPSSSGSDSSYTFKVEQLNTGVANEALYIDNRGPGAGFRIDDESGDTTPFVIDGSGNVGIQTSTPTEALQIGSGTNRGDASVYGDVTAEGYDIARSLTGIIDLFVYDTTRDSDGGEWRNSLVLQQLSWATETKDDGPGDSCVISTDDRCGKSVFPRKAILATTADALYVFDGADNSLWMKFTQAGTYTLGADANNNPSGVGAQNGVVVVGTNGSSATGMYAFDFKQDVMYCYNATNRVQADKNIGNRNSTVTYGINPDTGLAILDAVVNDVSIAIQTTSNEGSAGTTVAPIDSQAGPVRGVTLIAAATDSGVSVVHMGPLEVFNYSDASNNDYNQVVVTSRGRMYATNETLGQLEEWKNIDKDSASEIAGTPDRVYDETIGKSPITTGTVPTMSTSPGALAVIERGSSARESAATGQADSGDIVFVGTDQGLAEIHTSGGALVAASWSKLTTTTVAIPYMISTVRSAFLFDEAAGATAAVSAIGSGANVLDQAGATAPTFGGAGVRGNSVNYNNNSYLCSDADINGTCDADTDYNAGTVSFTVSLWFKHSVTAAANTLFERCYTPATPTAAQCIYAGMTATGAIRFAIDDDASWTYATTYDDSIISSALYNDNKWHYAVFTNTDTDICMYIDGRQAVACDTSLAATTTLDASQVLTVGGSCSGANCDTGTNFWDGSIDDFTWGSNGGTTAAGITAQSANKLYLDGRAHLIRPATTVTDATTFSPTTIGDSGETYAAGSFAGLVVELTGGTGVGQTRTIISNDATTLTVYPAFTTTPDATTDYRVSPAKLYGSTNNVTAISADLPTILNKVRKVYVGTSDGVDGGGISVFTNAGAGSIKTEVIHSDAGYPNDDLGSAWSGTDADDISAIASYSDTIAFGSGAFLRAQRKEVSLKQLQLDITGSLEDIRHELVAHSLFGSTQDVLGLGQGADLAEYYYPQDSIEAGSLVALDKDKQGASILATTRSYQPDLLGVVSASPGLVLGSQGEGAHQVALVGRVPVLVITQNGVVKAGDRITSSDVPGFGMKATQAGRVLGVALEDLTEEKELTCPPDVLPSQKCGIITVFVNLTDYYGQPVELVMAEKYQKSNIPSASLGAGKSQNEELINNGLEGQTTSEAANSGLVSTTVQLGTPSMLDELPESQQKILAFLKELKVEREGGSQYASEVFTDRVSAVSEIISPHVITELLTAKKIKADSIEGLEILTDKISSLQGQVAGLSVSKEATDSGVIAILTKQSSPSAEIAASLSTDTQDPRNDIEFESGKFTLDLTVLGRLSANGGLIVFGPSEFKGETVFERLATFLSNVVFKGRVSFEEVPTFNKDTAGFAIIKKGDQKVKIEFEKEYKEAPVVTVNRVWEVENDLLSTIEKLEGFFIPSQDYVLAGVTTKGFTIVLEEPSISDLKFNWVAIAVFEPKTHESFSSTGLNPATAAFDWFKIKSLPETEPVTDDVSPTAAVSNNSVTTPTTDFSPSPTAAPSVTPTPSGVIPSPTDTVRNRQSITVFPNESGFVPLRETPTVDGVETGRLEVGTSYPFLEKKDGWYQIKTGDRTGWVSETYVTEN